MPTVYDNTTETKIVKSNYCNICDCNTMTRCFDCIMNDDQVPTQFKAITNADRIREMSNKDLAWFLYVSTGCDHKCMHWKSGACHTEGKVCGEVWLNWLNKEVGLPESEGEP